MPITGSAITDFGCVENRYWLITDTVSFFSLPILAASRTGIGSLPIFENLREMPQTEPVMERRIPVATFWRRRTGIGHAAVPVLAYYRDWSKNY